jgi:hypothetical protein
MAGIEEIHKGAVLALKKSDFQFFHETTGGKPEIIAHKHDRLNMLAIALPKRSDQFAVLLPSFRMEPLLELV